MAFHNRLEKVTHEAAADLSGSQFKIVELNTDGKIELGSLNNGYGILQNIPQSGEAGAVAIRGASKFIAGAAVTIGDWISCKSGGWGIAVVSGALTPNVVLGQARTTVVSGSIGTVELNPVLNLNVVSGSIASAPPAA